MEKLNDRIEALREEQEELLKTGLKAQQEKIATDIKSDGDQTRAEAQKGFTVAEKHRESLARGLRERVREDTRSAVQDEGKLVRKAVDRNTEYLSGKIDRLDSSESRRAKIVRIVVFVVVAIVIYLWLAEPVRDYIARRGTDVDGNLIAEFTSAGHAIKSTMLAGDLMIARIITLGLTAFPSMAASIFAGALVDRRDNFDDEEDYED